MPFFDVYDHPQMPLTRIVVEDRSRPVTKDGFRLRRSVDLAHSSREHGLAVIALVDAAMGAKTKAPGVYQARYDEVRAAIEALPRRPKPFDPHPYLRWPALAAGIALTAAMCVAVPIVTVMFLIVSAIKRQSGFAAMAEATIIGSIFDWRPFIHRLFRYFKGRT